MADPTTAAIIVTQHPDPGRLVALGVAAWPIWSWGISTFPWTYDARETGLLLDAEVTVTPAGGEPVRFG
jgi:uncharacterized cupin superfamily protein